MARKVQAAPTERGVDVGDGVVIGVGAIAVISDEEFEALAPLVASGQIIDLGSTTEPETPSPSGRLTIEEVLAAVGGVVAAPPGPDAPPSVAHPLNDEFDGTATVTWFDTPAPATAWDEGETRPGTLHINGDLGDRFVGRLRPLGSVFPVTVTTKVSSTTARGTHQRGGGVLITEANPSPASVVDYVGVVYTGKFVIQHFRYTFDGPIQTWDDVGTITGLPLWLRVTFTSDTSAQAQYSSDGALWSPPFNLPGLNYFAGAVGLGVANEGGHVGGVSALFDYLRTTEGATP